mgnify:CR=1 FL=1
MQTEKNTCAEGYNGYPTWTAWNVYTWLTSDEETYNLCVEYANKYGAKDGAARLLYLLPEKTPDGARYSRNTVRIALENILSC